MKKLMLVRHAKSDWDNADLSDFERPLNKRGERDAPEMASRLIKKDLIPQYILSSPAVRAKTTANVFATEFKLDEPAYNKAIYEATYTTLLSIVNNLPAGYDFAAVVGHNPGMSQLLGYLTNEIVDLPTCAVAVIHFDVNGWELISGGMGTTDYYGYPKNGQ